MRRLIWVAGVLFLLPWASFAAEHLLAWVAVGEKVEVLDLTAGEILTTFGLDAAPTQLSLTPDLAYLYVSCRSDGQTRVLKPLSGKQVKRLPYIHPVFCAEDSAHFYAPGLGGVFRHEVDGYRFEQMAYLPDTQSSFAYAVSADGRWFVYAQRYVDWRGQGLAEPPVYERVAVCNLQEATGRYVELGAEPLCVAVSPTGERAAVGCDNGDVFIIALDGEPAVVHTEELGSPVRFVGFTPDGGELLFACGTEVFAARMGSLEEPPFKLDPEAVPLGGAEIVDGVVAPDGSLVVADGAGTVSLVALGGKKVSLTLEPGVSDLAAALVDEAAL